MRTLVSPGPQTEELMSTVMRHVRKVRVKALKRVQRNIGAFEMDIWEPDEEDKPAATPAADRFSLGPSVSSTLTLDLGSSLLHSDADTFSETLSLEEKTWIHLYQRYAGCNASTHFLRKRGQIMSLFPIPESSRSRGQPL
jgi:hypothetical protein